METKDKVRAMRRLIRKFNEESIEERSMDLQMDGSGELGSRIHEFHDRILTERIENVMQQIQMTPQQYDQELDKLLKIESPHAKYPNAPSAYYDMCICTAL